MCYIGLTVPTDTERLDYLNRFMIETTLLSGERDGQPYVLSSHPFQYTVIPGWYGDAAKPDIRAVIDEEITRHDLSHIPIYRASNVRGPLQEACAGTTND